MIKWALLFKDSMSGTEERVKLRIHSDMLLRRALPAARFDRNATIPVTDLVH